MTLKSFESAGKPTAKLAATTTSGATYASLDQFSNAVRIVNAGPNAARVRFSGPSAQQPAIATDLLILANTVEVLTKGNATSVASITDAGTAAMEFTDGEGF